MQDNKIPVLREPVRKRKGGKKLITVLVLLFIVILSVLFFNSSISKISAITVEGERFNTAQALILTAGIAQGDTFFGTTEKVVEERLKKLPTVESAVVTKSFPGKVNIVVKEFAPVAYELSAQGELTAILSNGSSISAGSDNVVDKPILSGWKKDDPIKAKLGMELAQIPPDLLTDFSEIIPSPSKAYPDRIKIYTRTHFEVITAVSLLKDKVSTLDAVVETQNPGTITMLLADSYVSFDPEEPENEE
ncbi:cell division protein FtsQ [Paenibacillus phyllosphaerae]|uniref:Cell division protein DivIB n=1 Tax=Paenibacillus phyllosphaerae TaxID=274593 RepID=A0A7W5FLD5_9BACL|nr:FtsQ-type POTRA domain-containing protein [Paenibacillus phyllosphaerae]MBB3109061.1 cell division protein FtsQ [Paenibacillus phyllosphaerae]